MGDFASALVPHYEEWEKEQQVMSHPLQKLHSLFEDRDLCGIFFCNGKQGGGCFVVVMMMYFSILGPVARGGPRRSMLKGTPRFDGLERVCFVGSIALYTRPLSHGD